MGTRERSIVIAAACVVLLVVVVRARRGDDIALSTATVTQGTVARQIFATGTLQPARTVAVGSQLSGTIQSIEADFNSRVRAGQVLARLDPAVYRAQLVGAQAKLAQAEAARNGGQIAVDDARQKLERAEQLAAQDLIAPTELDAARTLLKEVVAELTAAEAGIAEARASVAEATLSLDRTIIRSPVDGIVISRHVDVGQTVAATAETPVLFEVADLREMQLVAEISEGDVSGVQAGSRVTFLVESLGDVQFEGSVSSVRLEPVVGQPATATPQSTSTTQAPGRGSAPASGSAAGSASATTNPSSSASTSSANPQTPGGAVSYAAVIDVDNTSGKLMPGATAIIVIDGARRENAIRIPNNALSFRPSPAALEAVGQEPPAGAAGDERPVGPRASKTPRPVYVWKFEDGEFVPVAIETGLSDEKWTELVSGSLRPGDVLVTAATSKEARATNSR